MNTSPTCCTAPRPKARRKFCLSSTDSDPREVYEAAGGVGREQADADAVAHVEAAEAFDDAAMHRRVPEACAAARRLGVRDHGIPRLAPARRTVRAGRIVAVRPLDLGR